MIRKSALKSQNKTAISWPVVFKNIEKKLQRERERRKRGRLGQVRAAELMTGSASGRSASTMATQAVSEDEAGKED